LHGYTGTLFQRSVRGEGGGSASLLLSTSRRKENTAQVDASGWTRESKKKEEPPGFKTETRRTITGLGGGGTLRVDFAMNRGISVKSPGTADTSNIQPRNEGGSGGKKGTTEWQRLHIQQGGVSKEGGVGGFCTIVCYKWQHGQEEKKGEERRPGTLPTGLRWTHNSQDKGGVEF